MRPTLQQVLVSTKQALDPRKLSTLDDAELLRLLIAGEAGALEAIMYRHGSTVTAAARQILRDAADVEDVFQASFLVLLKSATKIQQGRSLGSWLFGVAHRLAVQARCRKAKLQTRERVQADLPEPAAPTVDLSWQEATALLHEELNRLPDRLREPLLLCHLEGKSRDEVATELGVSVGAVKGLLERGRAKLKGRLEKRGIAFSAGLFGVLATEGTALPAGWVDSTLNAVVGQAVRPAVQQLAQGVLPMSKFLKFTLATSVLVLASLFGVVTYIAAGGRETPPEKKIVEKPLPPAQPPAKAAADTFTVTGKVVGPDGQALPDVPLLVPVLLKEPPTSEADIGIKEVTRSMADGTFTATIKRTLVSRFLYARHKGHAMTVLNTDDGKDRADIELKMEQEFLITGRLLDTEGKPVVGAKVRTLSVQRPARGTLDDLLAEFKRDWQRALQNDATPLFVPFAELATLGATDNNGTFTLGGLPPEAIVAAIAESDTLGKVVFHVVTRTDFDPKPFNEAAQAQVPAALRLLGQPATLYGPKTDVVMPLGRVIEGTVTDTETGKPIEGVGVRTGDHLSGQLFAKSDKEGRYRLAGVRKQKQYLVNAGFREEKTSPYMMWMGRLEDTEGYGPMKHDIQLTRGIVVTGKLIDRTTGKGVFGYFRAAPLEGNEFFEKKPGYQAYRASRTSAQGEEDGTFRLLMIPGKSIILVQAPGSRQPLRSVLRPYLTAKPAPEDAKLFRKNGDDYYISTAGGSTESLSLTQAIKIVDLPVDAKEFKVDLYVERGHTATVHVVDADGKPVTKNVVSGAADHFPFVHRIDESTFTAVAIDPEKPRQIVIVNPERKLAGVAMLKGNAKEPIVVKLEPLGTITGQMVDLDGRPRVGVNVGPRGRGQAIDELYREAFGPATETVTDAQGKFTLPLVLPKIENYLGMRKGKEYYVGEKGPGPMKIEPGKVGDYGPFKTKVAQ